MALNAVINLLLWLCHRHRV